jgi:hypothetical protein
MKNEIHLSFYICGFSCKPEDISRLLDIQPDEGHAKGEPRGTGKAVYRESLWGIHSRISSNLYIESHISDIMERLEPVQDRIRNLPGKYYCYLSCGVDIYDGPGGPAVVFDAKTLRILGAIGASLDVDIYCLGGESGENENAEEVKGK